MPCCCCDSNLYFGSECTQASTGVCTCWKISDGSVDSDHKVSSSNKTNRLYAFLAVILVYSVRNVVCQPREIWFCSHIWEWKCMIANSSVLVCQCANTMIVCSYTLSDYRNSFYGAALSQVAFLFAGALSSGASMRWRVRKASRWWGVCCSGAIHPNPRPVWTNRPCNRFLQCIVSLTGVFFSPLHQVYVSLLQLWSMGRNAPKVVIWWHWYTMTTCPGDLKNHRNGFYGVSLA